MLTARLGRGSDLVYLCLHVSVRMATHVGPRIISTVPFVFVMIFFVLPLTIAIIMEG